MSRQNSMRTALLYASAILLGILLGPFVAGLAGGLRTAVGGSRTLAARGGLAVVHGKDCAVCCAVRARNSDGVGSSFRLCTVRCQLPGTIVTKNGSTRLLTFEISTSS